MTMLFSFPHVYLVNIATLFLRLTSCALNGPPLSRQEQSQKKKWISFCKRSNISVWKVAAQDQAHDFINVYAYEKCYASPVVPSMGCRTTGDGAKSKAQKKVMFS